MGEEPHEMVQTGSGTNGTTRIPAGLSKPMGDSCIDEEVDLEGRKRASS